MTETAHLDEVGVYPRPICFFLESLEDLQGAGGSAASGRSHEDHGQLSPFQGLPLLQSNGAQARKGLFD
jgi:hypothetical protein